MLTDRPPRKCLYPGCPEIGNWDAGYCPAHSSRGGSGRKVRPLEKLYRQTQWLKLFRPRFLSLNPVCQRIRNGVRCHRMSTELHHLVEPQTTGQFFDPKNVVGVCAADHPASLAGTPHWREGVDYAATVWTVPSFGG